MCVQLVGDWVSWEKYPLPIGEGVGAIIGKDLVIVSGFSGSFENTTKKVFAYDVTNLTAKWRPMDDVPVPGFHHAAYAVHGHILYLCGAYVGGESTVTASPICLKYTHDAPIGTQWTRLPDLPAPRGGGGMNRIVETNSLVYATGATRPPTTDWNNTWELSLDNLSAGWGYLGQILSIKLITSVT
jgi:N-acetylneuraminic acid mutarotase